MFRFVLRKMVNKKWMVLALLIGNILLVSIACANWMYAEAVLERTLGQKLEAGLTEGGVYPGRISVAVSSSSGRVAQTLEAAQTVRGMPKRFGLPRLEAVEHYIVGPVRTQPELERERSMAGLVALGMMSDLQEHIELAAGRMYSGEPDADGTIDVMVSERGMAQMNLLMGECFTMPSFKNADGSALRLRVCGVFRSAGTDDVYWVHSPDSLEQECLMAPELFSRLFLGEGSTVQLAAEFHMLLDYTAMHTEQAEYILQTAQEYRENFYQITSQSCTDTFSGILSEFLDTARKVRVTLWVLQTPVFVLLALFVLMVSGQMTELEQSEIAVLKSRGASRTQIVGAYMLQSAVIALLSLAAGIPLGAFMAQVLGSANEFLEFVQRAPLPVKIDGQVLLPGGLAVLLSMAAMIVPVLKYSRTTIVAHKQGKHRRSPAPLWQKLFLDIIVLAVSVYILYSYYGQRELLAQRIMDGASLDPLLFAASSLFMLGSGLLALRIIPVITFVIFRLLRRWWSPAMYSALLRVIRSRSQGFIMVFLVMTIALGVFNAQSARTINRAEEDWIRYAAGADIVLEEVWKDNGEQQENDPSAAPVYQEPDFGKYDGLEGAASVTRVLNISNASMAVRGGMLRGIQVLGIHTREFGETAWMRDGLLKHHFHEYLNAMAANSQAVLLSESFRTNYGYKLGDVISYQNAAGDTARGIVYGFVDYWPGYRPSELYAGSDGIYRENPRYLIVANLNQLQAVWGVTPYQVWIRAEDSTRFIYEFAQEKNVHFASFQDASSEIIRLKNDPVFQGTNGILTVGFVVVLTLCCAGFLIYWILSILSRSLQFGIYRAMGMSMREVVSMLAGEQIFISGLSIAAGVLSGCWTAKLFTPLLQMTYASYDNMLPLQIQVSMSDMGRLMGVVGAMMLLCMIILGWLIAKMKVAQALKLGED